MNGREKHWLLRLATAWIALSAAGIGLWVWVRQRPQALPPPDSKSGQDLLLGYQEITHNIWLIALALVIICLAQRIYVNRKRETLRSEHQSKQPIESLLRFIKKNPISSALFIAYGVAMMSGITYLHKDMLGWYPELVKGHFLDNFSIRQSFVSETMRRTDYRFFPLAHQDLHILSWFTIHIKTWILVSVAELISIVLLSIKFLNDLTSSKLAKQSTILLLTLLFLIHPSTGTAFFHVIYCERLLCLVFMLYITTYAFYRKTSHASYFYLTFLWALLGIYIKDIAVILFITPAASLWIADSITNQSKDKPNHRLEHWLCSLSLVFIASYIFLALIPSSFAGGSAYNNNAPGGLVLDIRCYLFGAVALTRAGAILRRRLTFTILDSINITAFAYATALALTYAFDANSYLALPVQLIATINIGWAWMQLVEPKQRRHHQQSVKIMAAAASASLIIGADHTLMDKTFAKTIAEQKFDQASTQATYEKLDRICKKVRESGANVHLIISQDSWLSSKRHLNRIHYRSLIEYEPVSKAFIVKDGANKGMRYTPAPGDLIANVDKNINVLNPILNGLETELIYRHNPSERSGMILRITGIKQMDHDQSSLNDRVPDSSDSIGSAAITMDP